MNTTDQQKIEHLAKIEGWTAFHTEGCSLMGTPPNWDSIRYHGVKDYLTSLDALRPVLLKLTDKQKLKLAYTLTIDILKLTRLKLDDETFLMGAMETVTILQCNPSDLAEAVLHATGFYKQT